MLERSFVYPAQVFKRMCDEAVTSFASVPTVYAMMLAQDAKQPLRFPSVRLLTNAAAALPVEFIPGLRRIFPKRQPLQDVWSDRVYPERLSGNLPWLRLSRNRWTRDPRYRITVIG